MIGSEIQAKVGAIAKAKPATDGAVAGGAAEQTSFGVAIAGDAAEAKPATSVPDAAETKPAARAA